MNTSKPALQEECNIVASNKVHKINIGCTMISSLEKNFLHNTD